MIFLLKNDRNRQIGIKPNPRSNMYYFNKKLILWLRLVQGPCT